MIERMVKKFGFTLMEMIVVVIIISIAAGLGIPTYLKAIDNSKYKERDSMLELLLDAAKMYKLERGDWPECPDGGKTCNDILNLNIPDTWDYVIDASGTVTASDPDGRLDSGSVSP